MLEMKSVLAAKEELFLTFRNHPARTLLRPSPVGGIKPANILPVSCYSCGKLSSILLRLAVPASVKPQAQLHLAAHVSAVFFLLIRLEHLKECIRNVADKP